MGMGDIAERKCKFCEMYRNANSYKSDRCGVEFTINLYVVLQKRGVINGEEQGGVSNSEPMRIVYCPLCRKKLVRKKRGIK